MSEPVGRGAVPRVFGTPAEPVVLDRLPRRAAANWPDRTALVCGERGLTFRQLDAEVDRFARAIAAALPGDGSVVGATTVLSPEFAALYYGIARAGQVIVSVNPYLPAPGLRHVLAASRTRLLFAPAALLGRLAEVRGQLPDLERVVVLDGPGGAAGAETLAEFLASGEGAADPAPATGVEDPGGLHFTSGTTGAPKAVVLSHRNLTVNAAQIAHAHRIDHTSVVANHLPLYHLMHLNSAVHAGATQVLCPGEDPVEALAAAERHRAVRLFSLPVRLARLAADPRLPQLGAGSLEAVLSGGSALPQAAAETLADHFGIPVLQGYGLAETSPVTHTGVIDDPRAGSVGPVVAGTECRIVEVDTRAVLGPGERGEVQVRGPQVMTGYLDPALPTGIDADGWFSTGDVGRVDEDGFLYLVDRLKDVFKHDNWLVSPVRIEEELARHPAVADCAVVDRPDGLGNGVAHAFVVVRPDGGPDVLDRIADFVNGRVAYYERIRHITALDTVPRSPNGKILRAELRSRSAAGTD
ncbi:class I adenylate-forming enzyme family protein [Kitasatospora sp. NPDC056446]|uniref:class I adenylate-forming enzyme family protein n=1 Tax=Kitasatospora sp. NPDC056446 TaxID=3345819 RepID=UPI0036C053CB